MNFEKNLQKYAELAIKSGVNIQPGQELLIRASINCAKLVRLATKEAYKCGAKNVYVDWSDEEISLIKYLNAPEEVFNEFPQWIADEYVDIAKKNGAFLSIISQDPDLLKDVNPQRISNFQKASGKALKEWRSYTMADKCKWSIIAMPSTAWAKKVFPDLDDDKAVDKLWEAILNCSRVSNGDPIENWKKHNANLKTKMDFLNDKNFKTLKYKSSKTNLCIDLVKNHIWLSGASKDPNGIDFNPNIPTEEVFVMPDKHGVNGVVYSTKPLSYSGNIIDNFSITFKNGKITDFTAEKGLETLTKLIETDEGSHYLGEVALVPYDSPISSSNIIFFNTLFDENASCHLAIGAAYKTNIKNGDSIKDKDLDKYGINDSLTHVDFMVGSNDLDIIGITHDGEEIQIFKNGNWAF